MIRTFRSAALATFWELGEQTPYKLPIAKELALILDILDAAGRPLDAAFAGMRFDEWQEDGISRFGISLSDRWLVSFAWDGLDAVEVDFELIN